MTFILQRASHCQQTGEKDGEETEGGDDAGRGREEACRSVQRTGTNIQKVSLDTGKTPFTLSSPVSSALLLPSWISRWYD